MLRWVRYLCQVWEKPELNLFCRFCFVGFNWSINYYAASFEIVLSLYTEVGKNSVVILFKVLAFLNSEKIGSFLYAKIWGSLLTPLRWDAK